jgi:hypothetical protein
MIFEPGYLLVDKYEVKDFLFLSDIASSNKNNAILILKINGTKSANESNVGNVFSISVV